MASPNVLVLSSPVEDMTIHSNVPYSVVALGSVTINDVPAAAWYDNCGHLVARVAVDTLEVNGPGPLTLTLGFVRLADGANVTVSTTITVKK